LPTSGGLLSRSPFGSAEKEPRGPPGSYSTTPLFASLTGRRGQRAYLSIRLTTGSSPSLAPGTRAHHL